MPKMYYLSELPAGAHFRIASIPETRTGTILFTNPSRVRVTWDHDSAPSDVAPRAEVNWVAGKSNDCIVVDGKVYRIKPGGSFAAIKERLLAKGHTEVFRF